MDQPLAPRPTHGLILAAGLGSRLADGAVQLKPLRPVGGRPLILRALEQLSWAGCHEIVIVTGHEAGLLEREVSHGYRGPARLRFVHNAQYRLQNGVSVLAARPWLPATFVLAMADHVVDRPTMRLAGAHQPPASGATLLVDYKIASVFDLGDATKVRATGARIAAIGKELTDYNCVDTGIFVCTDGLMEAIDTFYRAHGDASLSQGVGTLARDGRMTVLDIGPGDWMDVDTPEMLADAEARLARLG